MKTYQFLVIILMFLLPKANCQDTSKIQIVFETKLNQPVPLYKESYLGEINTEGYIGNHYGYQHGNLTKKELLLTAPNVGFFEKNKPVTLIMTDNRLYKIKFTVFPGPENQKWLLVPPGTDYSKSLKESICGGGGLLISSIMLLTVILINDAANFKYKGDMNMYNSLKNSPFDPGSKPTAPHLGALYLIPAVSFAVSIPLLVNGRNLYAKNKPFVKQIE
jgi:hypothetical protein